MTEDQISNIVQHTSQEIAEQIGAALDRYEAALETLHSELETQAIALEHGLDSLKGAISPDADEVKQAHEELGQLVQRMALADPEEQGELPTDGDPSAAMAGAAIAAVNTAAVRMHEAIESGTDAIQALHEPVVAEFAGATQGLESVRDTLAASIKATEDLASAHLESTGVRMEALGAEVNGLEARAAALFQSAHDHHDQAARAIEQALMQVGAHVVEGVQQAAVLNGAAFADSLVVQLRGASSQVEDALRQLDDTAGRVASVFESDIGRVVGQVEQVASLLQQIKPLLDAAEALM